jgi:gluconolactonase
MEGASTVVRTLGVLGIAGVACFAMWGASLRADSMTVINENSFYPEQPLWHRDALYYAEMSRDRVMKWDGAKNTPFWTRAGCGPTSIGRGSGDALIVLCHLQNALAKVDPAGRTLRVFDRDDKGAGFITPNGSNNDKKGGLYFSSSGIFADRAPAIGAVYYLGPNEVLRKVADGIHYANGVAPSQDGSRLFVSEHLSRRVLVYPINPDGSLGARSVFINLDDIVSRPDSGEWWVGPDGLLTDQHDNLYIAEYGAGRMIIVDKTGRLLKTIHVPEKFITAGRFGATEERIFITAPSNNTVPPFVGKVYSVPNPVFAGR